MKRVTLEQYADLAARIRLIAQKIEEYEFHECPPVLVEIHVALCSQLWEIERKAYWAY